MKETNKRYSIYHIRRHRTHRVHHPDQGHRHHKDLHDCDVVSVQDDTGHDVTPTMTTKQGKARRIKRHKNGEQKIHLLGTRFVQQEQQQIFDNVEE